MDIVNQVEVFRPLSYPFTVSRIEKDEALGQVHIYMEVGKDYRPSPQHTIHSYYERSWEHLRLYQYRSFLHCRLPVFLDRQSGNTAAMEVDFFREHLTTSPSTNDMTLSNLKELETKLGNYRELIFEY